MTRGCDVSAFETVLARARKARRTGRHTALISCPAPGHEDRHPSVTVTETPDGTVLMNCRSRGCDFASMVSGLGMRMADFFPPRLNVTGDFRPPLKRVTPAGDILAALSDEACVVYIIAHDFHDWLISRGEKVDWPSFDMAQRLFLALERIQAGASEATGRKIDAESERDEILRAAGLTPEEERDLDNLREQGVSLGRRPQQKEQQVSR